VNYGYDVHAISISEATFAQIQTGMPVTVQGQGFPVEGVMEQDECLQLRRPWGHPRVH